MGVQLADNARHGDAERLLLHHPVQHAPGRLGHQLTAGAGRQQAEQARMLQESIQCEQGD